MAAARTSTHFSYITVHDFIDAYETNDAGELPILTRPLADTTAQYFVQWARQSCPAAVVRPMAAIGMPNSSSPLPDASRRGCEHLLPSHGPGDCHSECEREHWHR